MLSEAGRLCVAAGDAPMKLFADAMILDSISSASPKSGSAHAALEAGQEAIAALERVNEPRSLCWAYLSTAATLRDLGQSGSAIDLGERAASIARDKRMARELALATVIAVGYFLSDRRTVPDGILRARRALDEDRGDLYVGSFATSALIVHLARADRLEEARALSDEAIARMQELGADAYVTLQWQSRASVEFLAQRWESAERYLRETVEFLGATGRTASNPTRRPS